MPRALFELKDNPNKQITENTRKIYHSNLNRVTKALGFSTDEQLIEHARQVIAWLDAQKYTVQQNKIFLSAVFYAINKPEFSDIQRKLFIDKFAQAKSQQIGALEDDEVATAAKEKLIVSKALQDENIKLEIKNLQEAARIAKKKLADAKRAAKEAL
jgi:hypothetical protein